MPIKRVTGAAVLFGLVAVLVFGLFAGEVIDAVAPRPWSWSSAEQVAAAPAACERAVASLEERLVLSARAERNTAALGRSRIEGGIEALKAHIEKLEAALARPAVAVRRVPTVRIGPFRTTVRRER